MSGKAYCIKVPDNNKDTFTRGSYGHKWKGNYSSEEITKFESPSAIEECLRDLSNPKIAEKETEVQLHNQDEKELT